MGLHMPELMVVLVAALLIFGPKKLPEMGSAIGKGIKAFRKSMSEITNPTEEPDLLVSTPKAALTHPEKDMHSPAPLFSTSEELRAEKHAD